MALKNNVVQTGLRYFGGKAKLAHSIIPYLPDHHCWVDLFGGAANMTIAREPSKVEVFNDKDGDLINFLYDAAAAKGATDRRPSLFANEPFFYMRPGFVKKCRRTHMNAPFDTSICSDKASFLCLINRAAGVLEK